MNVKLHERDKFGEYVDQSLSAKVRRFISREVELFRMHWRFMGWARSFGLWWR